MKPPKRIHIIEDTNKGIKFDELAKKGEKIYVREEDWEQEKLRTRESASREGK